MSAKKIREIERCLANALVHGWLWDTEGNFRPSDPYNVAHLIHEDHDIGLLCKVPEYLRYLLDELKKTNVQPKS